MSELFHECGVAAIYHLPGDQTSELCPGAPEQASTLITRMLLDMQNRGQLSAGITRYNTQAQNRQLLDTYRDIGSVQEVFRLSHKAKAQNLMSKYAGPAAIGHVRYATCGADDKSYAQPFENHNFNQRRWFSFAFNGQLANYNDLADELLTEHDNHLVRNSDTEVLMHEFSKQLEDSQISLIDMIRNVAQRLDGAWSLAYMNAKGEMLIARDALGIKPMCYAVKGPLFAAASESVALVNLGFDRSEIESLKPGHAVTIVDGKIEVTQFAEETGRAHCFFEWIYFANVASRLDDRGVYLTRTELGKELADLERDHWKLFEIDEDTIVVPVPDTSKAAADSMAFHLQIPSREGLIRNRYSGRTFIESSQETRAHKAKIKYTPLREVLEDKRVVLVEDSIVRSTTMKALLQRVRDEGGAREIHVRVACPPIMAPCYYGIDMSTIRQLFAPKFCPPGESVTEAMQDEMARKLGCDSLRYLPIESIARAIGIPEDGLCQACLTGQYPTPTGQKLYQIDKDNFLNDREEVNIFAGRAFDVNAAK